MRESRTAHLGLAKGGESCDPIEETAHCTRDCDLNISNIILKTLVNDLHFLAVTYRFDLKRRK